MAPVVEMPVYLPWLVARVEALGGTVTRMALSALPDRAEVVVNATGLGARRMADDSMVPVRGQVVFVDQVGLDRWWLDAGRRAARSTSSRVSTTSWSAARTTRGSGTAVPTPTSRSGSSSGPPSWCRAGRARVRAHRVGLRPARPSVRLEAEGTASGGRVVHCYGHGGAGVTLSWGCADEVAALVSA